MKKQYTNAKDIHNWLKIMEVKDYVINEDLTVNASNVNLEHKNLSFLPVKFNLITNNFICANNKLTTLEGAPNIVEGDFSCDFNPLINHSHMPKKIGNLAIFGAKINVNDFKNISLNPNSTFVHLAEYEHEVIPQFKDRYGRHKASNYGALSSMEIWHLNLDMSEFIQFVDVISEKENLEKLINHETMKTQKIKL
jgi:hypothetical protein